MGDVKMIQNIEKEKIEELIQQILPTNTPLQQFQDALTCSPPVYSWRYAPDGTLLETNCPIYDYHLIFEHSGCLSYMLEDGETQYTPLVLNADLGIQWCVIYKKDQGMLRSCYVLGPVFNTEVDHNELNEVLMRRSIALDYRPVITKEMYDIPVVSTILFFQYAILLHYYISEEKLQRSDLRFQKTSLPGTTRNSSRETRKRHQTYLAESALLQMVRNGDPNYHAAMEKAQTLSTGVGIKLKNPVRRAVVSACNFTALCTRAAIEGGLMPDTAYTVGDSYIQELLESKTISDVHSSMHAMYEDFIQRVNRQHRNPQYSQQIQSCVSYIETHIEEELSLTALAQHVGYTEYHLSRKFKAETGENIRDHIRYTKVERAKILLSSTDRSVREIAEDLHFCSGSHFSKIFREVTGTLPQQYREEHFK